LILVWAYGIVLFGFTLPMDVARYVLMVVGYKAWKRTFERTWKPGRGYWSWWWWVTGDSERATR
jgi:hypothetical protein